MPAGALTTAPNAALPAGARIKRIEDALDAEPPAGRHAAGVAFVAPGPRVLLLRRSPTEGNFALHWSLPGGGVDAGETIEDAVRRECREEIGGYPDGQLRKVHEKQTPTGMTFHTFAQKVPATFEPRLNAEHVEHRWAPLDQLPAPMHPAVAALLREKGADVVGDASSADNPLLADVLEARPEPRSVYHRQKIGGPDPDTGLIPGDAALAIDRALAYDRAESVRSYDRDGRLHVSKANIAKANICPYRGKEIPKWKDLGLEPETIYQLLRDPDELAKAAATWNGVQILRKHKPVNADDHKPYDVIGAVGTNGEWEEPHVTNALTFWPAADIEDIESERKKQLSPGYHYRADMTPGIFAGKHYDGVMRDIVGNHLVTVEEGRQGDDVVVGDELPEGLMDKAELARRIAAVSNRTGTMTALYAFLTPRLKPDARKAPLGIAMAFDGVTGKNFKEKAPAIVKAITDKVKPLLAMDDAMQQLPQMMDTLAAHEDGTDESVSQPQHNAMEAAAHGNSNLGIPQAVGSEFAQADKGKGFDAEPIKAFLRDKISGDDMSKLEGMFPKPATDEDEEAKKKREAEEKAKKEAEDKAARDNAMKIGKDEALKLAEDAVLKERANQTEIRKALAFVKPWVGELSPDLAFDSAEGVHRHVLTMLGHGRAKTAHADALPDLITAHQKPSERRSERATDPLALDEKALDEAVKLAPGLEHITIGV